MTSDPLAARVHALIAQWREKGRLAIAYALCADELEDALEAALAAALAPPISTDEQVDIFVHRLELLLHRKTGNTWEANQLRAVRALFHDALAAAALAPKSEQEK